MPGDFKARMRQHPLAPKRTLAVPGPAKPVEKTSDPTAPASPVLEAASVRQPAFEIPVEGEPTTLDALVALSKNGTRFKIQKLYMALALR